MSARERILDKLRAATKTAPASAPDVGQWFAGRQRNESLAQRIERFRAAMLAAHAEVHDTTEAGWPEALAAIAQAKGVEHLLVGAGTADGERLQGSAGDAMTLVRYEQPIDDWRDTLFDQIDAGLTRVRGAIAETGSLILWPDASEPRAMSLVPPIHFALLEARSIHADFHSVVSAERWHEQLPTNALLISGPSKTADIQQTLAYGAHGPRELIVLLINDQGGAA